MRLKVVFLLSPIDKHFSSKQPMKFHLLHSFFINVDLLTGVHKCTARGYYSMHKVKQGFKGKSKDNKSIAKSKVVFKCVIT